MDTWIRRIVGDSRKKEGGPAARRGAASKVTGPVYIATVTVLTSV